MSRKTRRNASRKAIKQTHAAAKRPAGDGRGFSGLAIGAMAFSGPLFAADGPPASSTDNNVDTLQEVVVTGIRASLQKSMDIKEQSVGVIDAISAEDIGNFPDSGLGEALQRIPGVTVDRTGANVAPGSIASGNSGAAVSIGDATSITVRGFGGDFNETLIDGRPMASALGRAFDYASVGADFVSELDVLKTPDYSLSSGAIGATVNIKFPKPFDHPGLQARVSAATTDYQNDGQFTPAFGALFSNTFFDDTVGILIDGDYTHRTDDEHHLDIVGWKGTNLNSCQMAGGPTCLNANGTPMSTNPLTFNANNSTTPQNTYPSWYAQEYALYNDRTDDRRKDARAVLQWHPNDALMITLNDDYSDDRQLTYRSEYSTWFNSNEIYNVTQDGNGTINNFLYGPSPTDFNADYDGTYIQNNEFGANVRWDVTNNWTAQFDADQSASHLNPGGQLGNYDSDVGYGPAVAGGTNGYTGGIAVPGGNALPYPTAFGPNNNAANVLGSGIIGSHVFPISQPYSSDYINQGKIDATWHTDDTKVNFGLQFTEDTRNQYENDDFTNNGWQLFSGYGPASNNTSGQALPQSLFTGSISTANFLPGWTNNGKLPGNILEFNPSAVEAYLVGLGAAGANPGTISGTSLNGTPFPQYAGGPIPLVLNPSSIAFVREKTYSPFIKWQQKFKLADMPLTADLGVRYERTDVSTGGVERLPTALTVETADHTAFDVSYSSSAYQTVSNSYHYVLPSLDLNLLVTPEVKVRLDASRTLTRPPLSDITPTLTITGSRVGALSATGNNPDLLPYLSDNYDLGAEWYYGRNDYLSADGFFKHVTQFPFEETVPTTFPGVIDPTTGQLASFAESTFVNGPSANVEGVEVTWQHMLPLDFGFMVNGTVVHTNKPYNRYDLTTEFALPGLANSANLVAFYQAHGFQARVAVNWQADQFTGFGQEQNGSAFGTEPTFLAAHTEVDFSTSYDIGNHVSVFFEALNLTDAQLVTHGRFNNQILNVIDTGRIFTIGVRAKL
jgi:iron complex outermembrane receptor protein